MSDDDDIQKLPVNFEEYKCKDWSMRCKKSHILHSQCTTSDKCSSNGEEKCLYCVYTNTLDLPHLPEMIFPNNVLSLTHYSGAELEFNALDALKCVDNNKLSLKVACSEEWNDSRSPEFLGEKIKPFDWTYSSDYSGSLRGPFSISKTDERINIERLKEKEKILFYNDLMLYEDELHDNGIASCTVKIRVMPSSYFILLRYFLRVDNVLVRINDTRIFHDFTTNYILREFTNKESSIHKLNLPLPLFADPNLISSYLPLNKFLYEKLIFPKATEDV